MPDSLITIEAREEGLYAGLLENGRLKEYHRFDLDGPAILGSIVMGHVDEQVGGLNSFLVNIRQDKKGFLNTRKGDKVRCGDMFPVQIIQEGSGDKGYRVTREFSLDGHNVVLTPFDLRTSISLKIESEALKTRFKALREQFPDQHTVGWIFRTDAAAASEEEILEEAKVLYDRYQSIMRIQKTSPAGSILYAPPAPVLSFLLSQPRNTVSKIVVDDKNVYKRLKEMVQEEDPELSEKVFLFDQGRWSIREFYKLTSQLMTALSRKVLLSEGISVVIDQTEALTAIDVNSGSFAYGGKDREKTIFEANRRAADVILEQIRLRNLSGILIIDFIDMKSERSKEELLHYVKEAAKKDRQRVTVHDYTRLGLMELTRKRADLPLSSFLTTV